MEVEAAPAETPLSPSSELGPYRTADYFALPDEPRCELLYGRIYVSPSPGVPHQVVAAVLFRLLDDIAGQSGGWAGIAPLDIVLADHSVVQPDVVYLTREHRSAVKKRIAGIPDLLVEVLSPGSIRRDRTEKLRLYAESGIREYWLVDPPAQQIEFLVNRSGRFEVALPLDGIYRSPVLSEITLDLAELWRQVGRRL
ncbi:MAG TPA: Uma2 family endonuclease [Thermoanaerobaculia bacterium]|nr:Uma2 family endonuclease [Thermoanaerobaculia bacterium]